MFLVLLAGTAWVASGLLSTEKDESPKEQKLIRAGACGLALLGFIVGLLAAIFTADDEPRPQIQASLSEDARTLTAKVSASSMETEDRLAIWVDALTRTPNTDEFTTEPVYRAYEGPDGDGNVKLKLTTNIPEGPYTDVGVKAFTDRISEACDDLQGEAAATNETKAPKPKRESGTGCVTMAIVPK